MVYLNGKKAGYFTLVSDRLRYFIRLTFFGKIVGCKLNTLICIEDFWLTIVQDQVERFQAESAIESVRELPGYHETTEPFHPNTQQTQSSRQNEEAKKPLTGRP